MYSITLQYGLFRKRNWQEHLRRLKMWHLSNEVRNGLLLPVI